jgi:crotonobetainyl-CoA:carnitine CoA-transferase CaiB-like acyl-CoA transferase
VIGVPVQLSETPGRIGSAAPLLGADTATILKAVNGG